MPRSRAPLFLARAVYRRRRLRDAARLLPLVGVVLMVLPALWSGPPGQEGATQSGAGSDAVFIFAVWFLLIGGAALLAPALADPERTADPDQAESGD
jgi:hypothetical protein